MKKIIVIGGPTATGKTKLGVELAKKFNGTLINADSRQIYKYLNIGTNKEPIEFPISLIDLITPDQQFSVYDYQQLAYKIINESLEKGQIPILVGGTGLYIDSVIKNYTITNELENSKRREELSQKSISELQEMIDTQTLELLNNSDRNNPRRLVRIIEKKDLDKNSSHLNDKPKYHSLFLYPEYNWDELKIKIEDRVEEMFNNGLVEETKNVLSMGFKPSDPGLKVMGYSQVIQALNGEFDLGKCKELVKFAHKQYAKRQRTWFEGEGRGYELCKVKNISDAFNRVEAFL